MKYLVLIILLFVVKISDSISINNNAVYTIEEVNVKVDKWEMMIYKIMKHETANFTDFIGDSGKAVGYMHMWKVYVDDVNNILDTAKYTYNDRMDSLKCIEMFNIYQDYWNPEHDIQTALRIHNSGPKGRFNQFAYLTEDYINQINLEL